MSKNPSVKWNEHKTLTVCFLMLSIIRNHLNLGTYCIRIQQPRSSLINISNNNINWAWDQVRAAAPQEQPSQLPHPRTTP